MSTNRKPQEPLYMWKKIGEKMMKVINPKFSSNHRVAITQMYQNSKQKDKNNND